MLKTLLFGAAGQLGACLLSHAIASEFAITPAPRAVRIDDQDAVEAYLSAERPQWVINAAAMTDVDAAHLDPEAAMRVNGLAPGLLAAAAQRIGARLIHISSEAVFDGERQAPYSEVDACRPVSVYGVSKLTGDELVQIFSPDSYVLRTSWLYSGGEGMNFPTRILAQLADPGRQLSVVTDVVGNPTPTTVLASAIGAVMRARPEPGLYHVCCRGEASKFDWAVEIAESAGYDRERISAVTATDYPTVALRPKHVDLDCRKFVSTGLYELPTWREAWRRVSD